jgi:endonuclease/exonuclease/phosphatase family metal-dependent hydrolase
MRDAIQLPRSMGGVLLAVFGLFILQARADTTVRVMSANLNGNTQSYQPFALRIFQGLKPDIVAIQEFNYLGNTAADFRSMVDTAFGTNFYYLRETNASYQIPNGVISRYPIVEGGSWADAEVSNRGFAWAKLALPGTNYLYVVSVHLLSSSSSSRTAEAAAIKSLVQSNFPAGSWVIVAGDFNTDTRSESALSTFGSFLSDQPIPTDAESGGDADTNEPRSKPYDYVLPSFSLTNLLTPCVFPSHSYSNGLVFDTRVYAPLSEVAPILAGDSTNAQHMAVIKDFAFDFGVTNVTAPVINGQPQSQSVVLGSNATFSVVAVGSAPLSYQWQFNGTNIASATLSSYTRTNAQPEDEGSYSVVVTNVAGNITSSNAVLTVSSGPFIVTQPQNRTVAIGQDGMFAVTATGLAPLSYQWRFEGANILGATLSNYTRTNAQLVNAGNYTVVISNSAGSITSSVAVLTVTGGSNAPIAQWTFNSIGPDNDATTGTLVPAVGIGSAAYVGGTTANVSGFAGGSGTDTNTDNSGWNTGGYPSQGNANKTAGVRFDTSTAGYQAISVRWDQRASSTGSKYARLQYTTNGMDYIDFPTGVSVAGTSFEAKTNNLAAFPTVNNNVHFGFRIVTEFESSALNNINSNYVGASSSYSGGGTLRFDMVTVSGMAIVASNPPAAPAQLGGAAYTNGAIQFTVSGSAGSNYVVQTTTNFEGWISLWTNAAPFDFVDTNTAGYPAKFYRALSQ